ncbi:MAG: hypothetical protein K0V04_26100 [Deltaproteobacteria bacterium]|nr:hypothetical protein [Deltaproteobacteria bacterium]
MERVGTLNIRAAQLDTISAAQLEVRAVAHLREHFPHQTEARSDDELCNFIRGTLRRAAEYGLEAPQGWAHFLNICMALGPDFDADPELPWARAILISDAEPSERVERLVDAVVDHLVARASMHS